MIFPSGKRKNIDSYFNPLTDSPQSPFYEPELKKNVKKAGREESNGVEDPRSLDYQPELKSGLPKKHDWAEKTSGVKQADTAHDVLRSAHSISSARAGNLSDIGGPVRQMKSATSNSIWDHAVLERIKAGKVELDKGEQIKADNKKLAEERAQLRKTNFLIDINDLKSAMGRGDLDRSSNIKGAHASDASSFSGKVGRNQQSMFGEDKFATMDELTPGEQIKQAAKDRKGKARKDRSWENQAPANSTKKQLSSFFDGLNKSDGGK